MPLVLVHYKCNCIVVFGVRVAQTLNDFGRDGFKAQDFKVSDFIARIFKGREYKEDKRDGRGWRRWL